MPPEPLSRISLGTIFKGLVKSEYAVRGELLQMAEKINAELKKSPESFKFKKLHFCNVGNPQELGQPPITYYRQIMSLLEYREILSNPIIVAQFPKDVVRKASSILETINYGAYSSSQGYEFVRKSIASFIERRDGHPANPNHIFLRQGASEAIQMVLRMLVADTKCGVLIPIPQYPLYNATIVLLQANPLHYYLNEDDGWSLDIDSLEAAIQQTKVGDIEPRCLVIINPGNPTPGVLSYEKIQAVIKFAYKNRLALLVDEVYQENIFDPVKKPFLSFKKVLREMGGDIAKHQPLFSFHTVSKGYIGECGRRGGYVELVNIDEEVVAQFYKFCTITLCPTISGQMMLGLMTDPPQKGDESYDLYTAETKTIKEAHKWKANLLMSTLKEMEGVTCQEPEGSMYLFPCFQFPPRFIRHAQEMKKPPDTIYCIELLKTTGICTVPGTGFLQKSGTHHVRFTILFPEEDATSISTMIKEFHADFMMRYK